MMKKFKNFGKLWWVIPIFVLFFIFALYYKPPADNTIQIIEEKLKTFNPFYVNDCQVLMMEKELTYALCTLEDGTIVLKDSTIFKPTDYLCLQVNLQKLDIPFDPYYICGYSDFPIYETSYPKRYGEIEPGIRYPSFICSSLLHKKDFHNLVLSGFILNKKGKYTIMKIYAFDGNLPANYDFEKNLDKGIVVFDLKGQIK